MPSPEEGRFTGRQHIATILQEEAPCDNCPMWNVCKLQQRLCLDFQKYIHTGICHNENRFPTRGRFNAAFPGHLEELQEASDASPGERGQDE